MDHMAQNAACVEWKTSVVVSTMTHRTNQLERLLRTLEEQSSKPDEVVIVCQRKDETAPVHSVCQLMTKGFEGSLNIKMLKSNEVGLSCSRNLGIRNASGDIIMLADDDCEYPPDAVQTVKQEHTKDVSEAVITFQIRDRNSNSMFRDYPKQPHKHSLRSIMHVSSVEITMKRAAIKGLMPLFDERFGLGRRMRTGEETIMLADLLRKKVRMVYVPAVIVMHPRETSSLSADNEMAISRGAMFRRVFGGAGIGPAIVFYAMRLGKRRRLRYKWYQFWYIVSGYLEKQ